MVKMRRTWRVFWWEWAGGIIPMCLLSVCLNCAVIYWAFAITTDPDTARFAIWLNTVLQTLVVVTAIPALVVVRKYPRRDCLPEWQEAVIQAERRRVSDEWLRVAEELRAQIRAGT